MPGWTANLIPVGKKVGRDRFIDIDFSTRPMEHPSPFSSILHVEFPSCSFNRKQLISSVQPIVTNLARACFHSVQLPAPAISLSPLLSSHRQAQPDKYYQKDCSFFYLSLENQPAQGVKDGYYPDPARMKLVRSTGRYTEVTLTKRRASD